MLYLTSKTRRGGSRVESIGDAAEAKARLKSLCKQHLPATLYDEPGGRKIGAVWKNDGHWAWYMENDRRDNEE